ncbi:MAG: XRE family transcriptional regulator [Microbacteriaceae bacterium]|nr:MAG: XRE family transcriptional regulator [Microbacteriaceae bacterium]
MSLLNSLSWFSSEAKARRRARALAEQDYRLVQELVRIRRERGLSQADVAELLGITQQAVSKLERPGSDPRLSRLRQYSHAVGALVGHVAEIDGGQLDRGDWTVIACSVPSTPQSASKTYKALPAANVKRTDVALAG